MHHKSVMTIVGFQQQMRILHWQTKKYSRHIAYGSIYDSLDDFIDKFAEVCMGKYGRVELSEDLGEVKLKNLDELTVGSYIDEFIDFLKGLNDVFDPSKDSDVLNIRDEILAEANKLKYLLTLS
jgi:hypothetical protein